MQIAPVAPTCLQALAGMLLEVCKNPTQPGFNHFLFESVAALVRYTAAAGGGAGGVERLEAQLFPAFQLVLQQDVQARTPDFLRFKNAHDHFWKRSSSRPSS